MSRHPLSHPMTSRQSLHCTPGFPCFHVGTSTPNLIPDHIQPPPPPITVNDEPEFKISKILDSKIDNHCHACKLLYLVHWTGYEGTDKETSWILTSELGHASKLRHASKFIVDFHSAYLAKSGPLSSLWLLTSELLVFFIFLKSTLVIFMFKSFWFNCLLQCHFYIFQTSAVLFSVSSISGVVIWHLLLGEPLVFLGMHWVTNSPSHMHLMHFPAHGRQAFCLCLLCHAHGWPHLWHSS